MQQKQNLVFYKVVNDKVRSYIGTFYEVIHGFFKKNLFLLFLLSSFFEPTLIHATTYYSRTTGTFATPGTWSINTNGSPTNAAALTAADVFIIQSGHTVTVGAAPTFASITVQSGGILTQSNSYTWTIPILTINNGGLWNISTRTCTMNGTVITNDGTISGTTAQLTLGTGAASFTNNNIFSVSTGRLNVNARTCTNNGSITFSSTGRLILTTGTFTNEASGTVTFSTSGTVTFATGNMVNNNTSSSIDFGSTAITITGAATDQQIGGFVTTGRLSCTKASGTVTLNGDVDCGGLTMNGTGTMNLGSSNTINTSNTVILTTGTLNGGSSTIKVNIVSTSAWSGTGSVFVPSTSTVNFNASGNQTLSATGTKSFYNLSFSNTGTKTNALTTVDNIFSLEGGSVPSETPTYGASATLQYNTSSNRTAGAEWLSTFDATGGVIIANTGIITSNGNKVFSANVPLTINSGATLSTGANSFTFNSDFINNGTWTASSGDIEITGAGTQNIGIFNTTGLVAMTKNGGTATFTGGENGGAFTMNGSGGGTLDLGTGLTHTFIGTWTNTGGFLIGNTSTLNIEGTSTGTGSTFTANTSTVNFTSATAQSIPAFSYYDLNFTGGGVKTLSGTTNVANVLTINSPSELDLSSITLNLTGGGTPLVSNGIFTGSTSTVNYTSASPTTIAAVNYYNLDGTGGDRTLSTAANIGIAGVFTAGAGTYTVTNSIVDFNGIGDQIIPSFTFHTIIISNSGNKSILGGTIVYCKTMNINNSASLTVNADAGAKLNIF